MRMCKFITFLYDLIPIQSFRAYLIQKHFAKCPGCQNELDIDTLLEEKFKIPDWVESEPNLWPQIREKICTIDARPSSIRHRARRFSIPFWQWTAAGLALFALLGISLLVNRYFHQKNLRGEFIASSRLPRIIITHAEINGKKARPFVYQTREECFIWFEESKQ